MGGDEIMESLEELAKENELLRTTLAILIEYSTVGKIFTVDYERVRVIAARGPQIRIAHEPASGMLLLSVTYDR